MSEVSKSASGFSATIAFDAPGKHFGQIEIPYSRDEAGLGNLRVPVISIRNGEGPCLLFVAGNHGDELEGQIALRKLVYELEPSQVSGQLIVVPSLNLPAVLNNSRCSPIDDLNMNRIFPGNSRGTVSEKIAAFVQQDLLPRVDAVIDLHAGGRNLNCLAYAMMHRYENPETMTATLALMKAFAAPYAVVYDTEPDREGMLDTAVEDLDKPFIAVELGGLGSATPGSVQLTARGVRNVLVHAGLIEGEIDTGGTASQLLAVPEGGHVIAEDHGLFESFVEIGDEVTAGSAIGQLHSIHRPDRMPILHHAGADGIVMIRRTTGITTHGDYLAVVGTTRDTDL